jgi:hypothetical protein
VSATEKLTLDARSLEDRVGRAVGELSSASETLRGLAVALDGYAGTSRAADFEDLRHAAIGIRASAVQTLLTACTVVGLSERLATFGGVLELAESGAVNEGG